MPPGDNELTLTPKCPQYDAKYLVNPIMPVLITEYVTGFFVF